MLFARLRAKDSSSTTAPGPELAFGVPDIRDIIEGLFLSTGPNAYQSPSNPSTAFWAPWAPGRPVVTRVAALTDTEYGYVERSLQQVEEVSQGSLKATIVERVGVPFPSNELSRSGELRVLVHPDMQTYCGNPTFGACAAYALSPQRVIDRVYVAMSPNQPGDSFAHEIAHAVLGLRHIHWGTWNSPIPGERAWPGLPPLVMTPGAQGAAPLLSPTEAEAVRMVFAAGIPGGAGRSAFHAAGLINNP
jgi:hypothetical protein